MKNGKERIVRHILLFALSAFLIVLIGFIVAVHILIPTKLKQQLMQLRPGLQIRYSGIHTDLFASTITLDSVDVLANPNNNGVDNFYRLRIQSLRFQKINFFKFLVYKNLTLNSIELNSAKIYLDSIFLSKLDSIKLNHIEFGFQQLSVKEILFPSATIFLHSPQGNKLIATGNIVLAGIHKENNKKIRVNNYSFEFYNINTSYGPYTLSAGYFYADTKKQKLKAEKIKIENKDDTVAFIDKVSLSEFDINDLLNKKFIADNFNISGVKISPVIFLRKNFFTDIIKIKKFSATNIIIAQQDKIFPISCTASISMHELLIDHLYENFSLQHIKFTAIHADLNNIRTSVPGKLHNIAIDNASLDSRTREIKIHSLKITPQFGKLEYGRRCGVQGNWVKANLPEIKILDADIFALVQQKLIAGKMIVAGSNVYVYRDRRLPRKLLNQKLPAAFIKALPLDIRLQSLTIQPSLVVYEEQPNDWIHTGILRLEKMQVTISPVINHPTSNDPDYIEMKAFGSVMGSGTATAIFKMPLRKNDLYYVKGNFQNLSLPALNSSAENLGDFSIRSGLLNFLNFEFTMSAQKANGKIVGAYHNLVVDKVKIDSKDSTRKEKAGFSSFILHHLIIPKNKDASLPLHRRMGKVDYLRDPTRFVTYYFIKSLLDGVRSSFTFGFVLPK